MGKLAAIALAVSTAACGRTEGTVGMPYQGGPFSPDTGSDAPWDVPHDTAHDVPPADGVDVPWEVEPPPGFCPAGWTCRNYALPTFSGVDILVVVDNSMSMNEEQANMAEQFPLLIDALLDPPINPTTGRPVHVPITDLHIGVVSADMGTGGYMNESCPDPVDGDDGILLHDPNPTMPGCDPSYSTYLDYDVDAPDPDLVDWMAAGFGCIGVLGIDGCGFEQQLKASLKALAVHAAPGGPNHGFLRDDTVLVVFWLTDEEDCSVAAGYERIFDTLDSSLGHLNLRCFNHSYMVEPVGTYYDGLRSLREGSIWPVILGMIVGVPPGEKECEGYGDRIGRCLEMPLMQERVDPLNPTRLVPSCATTRGEAYPPRRFVELAQAFGPQAYVQSICQSDFTPAIGALSSYVNTVADYTCEAAIVRLEKDTLDPCLCLTNCEVVHVLAGDGPCPSGMAEWDHDGDTVPDVMRDEHGSVRTPCRVPYGGTEIGMCDRDCHDPYQTYATREAGWHYSLSYTGVACPSVSFTAGSGPPAGAITFVACPP